MGENRALDIKSALEDLRERSDMLKMTTGLEDLDNLIGGIEAGNLYLFYGCFEIIDLIVHSLLVNCVMPIENGGLDAKAVYFNNTDYYTGKTIIDPSRLGALAKNAGVDPDVVLKNVEVAAAYNEERQLLVSKEISNLLMGDEDIKLLVAHDITRFLVDSKKPKRTIEILKKVVGDLWRATSQRNIAFVMTAERAGGGSTPKPSGGAYLRQLSSILVCFEKSRGNSKSTYRVTLVKHPCKRTPESITLYVGKPSDLSSLTRGGIGPFQQLYNEQMGHLKIFQNDLIDLGHKSAFDTLLGGAFKLENKAIKNLRGFTFLDGLNLTATVDTRALIESLQKRLVSMDAQTREIFQDVESIRGMMEKL